MFIYLDLNTTSPQVNDIKLTEQYCGPAPELSQSAINGLL